MPEMIYYRFTQLNRGATYYLEQAEATEEASYYNAMSAMLYAAFTLEAYLNHLGSQLFRFWPQLERLRPEEKLIVITSHANVPVDFGRRPFQSFRTLFAFRNAVAHWATESVTDKCAAGFIDVGEMPIPQTRWDRLCTPAAAKPLVDDTRAIIDTLNAHSPNPVPLGLLGVAGGYRRVDGDPAPKSADATDSTAGPDTMTSPS